MNKSNVVIMELEDYNRLLRERDSLEQKIRDTFQITEKWTGTPTLRIHLEQHREYLAELLAKTKYDETYMVGALDDTWQNRIDAYEMKPELVEALKKEQEELERV